MISVYIENKRRCRFREQQEAAEAHKKALEEALKVRVVSQNTKD